MRTKGSGQVGFRSCKCIKVEDVIVREGLERVTRKFGGTWRKVKHENELNKYRVIGDWLQSSKYGKWMSITKVLSDRTTDNGSVMR